MDANTILVGLIAGCFGMGYMAYGKKTGDLWFVICGLLMMFYPYFISGVIALITVGILLFACPFVADHFF